MADLILANSTYSVGTIDSASTVTNNVTATDAQHINGLASAIVQVETVLGSGTDLKGTKTDLVARLAVSLASNGTLVLDDYLFEPGDICTSLRSSKTGWLLMDGTERSATTYETLFDQIVSLLTGTAAYAIRYGTGTTCTGDAGTDTFTAVAHGLSNNTVVYFTTTNTLPTGMSALTKYYIVNTAADTFQISTTLGGAAVDITSAGVGVHKVYSTFICDARGTFLLGKDSMGGSSRNRSTDAVADTVGQGGGSEAGVAAHVHSVTDPGHTHTNIGNTGAGAAGFLGAANASSVPTGSSTTGISIDSSGTSTGNMPPYTTVNFFIKT